MPIEPMPKEVDPDDVALAPEDQICEDIYQRVLSEVRAHIDQRIAAMEAQAAASESVESGAPAAHRSEQHAGVYQAIRRRRLLLVAIGVMVSAGLFGAVAILAHDTSVTNWMQEAAQLVRQKLQRFASTGGPEASTGSSSPDVTATEIALVAPASASSSPPSASGGAAAARSGDPSAAMAEAMPERDGPSAVERDVAPLIEKIAHVVGELQIGLRELKASQEQAGRDHARAIEQLRASQDQLTRTFRSVATTERQSPRPAPRPPRFPYQ